MNLQVLVSTMYQNDYSLLKKMNIDSDAIVINQCDKTEIEGFRYNGKSIKWYSLEERGVGLSRNTALMRATADICLFADDDVCYINNYEDLIVSAFNELPNADVIVFDINIINSSKEISNIRSINRIKKLHTFNSMRYGACRIAIKRDTIIKSNIYFSLMFGGGALFSAGEDSLFLRDCHRRKLNVYAYPLSIAQVDDSNSTWYKGVNEKYIVDKGAFLYIAFPHLHHILFIYYAYRTKNIGKNYSMVKTLNLFKKGKRAIKLNR